MKILSRENIDISRWDKLVAETESSSVFSFSWYLDATAENWSVLVDDKYSSGMALPFSIRLGVKLLYTPIFVRYIEWLGAPINFVEAQNIILAEFKNVSVSMKQPILGSDRDEFIFQSIPVSEIRTLSSQAKRSLKKAENKGIQAASSSNYMHIEKVVKTELVGKYQGIDNVSIKALVKLFAAGKSNSAIKVFEIGESGGIVCLENESSVLYLKGTVSKDMKDIGGMYACVDEAIKYAKSKNKIFDFGGSRIEGVKRFNHNLGGVDQKYYNYTIDNAPIWFKLARRIRNKWSKK
ncbi:MAG: hypothetical protein MK105_17340 [Crocinitomicaceae bacterium]|nr:hypothetical protein [Crocinitomicaceae bacterium]